MKKYLIKAVVFFMILLLPNLFWFGIKKCNPNLYKDLVYDLGENRTLAKIPTVKGLMVSGDEINQYYSDIAPFRSPVISLYRSWDEKTEMIYDKVIMPSLMSFLYGKSTNQEKEFSGGAYDFLFGYSTDENENGITKEILEENKKSNCEHGWELIKEQEALCTQDTYKEWKCKKCEDIKVEKIDAKGHDWEVLASVEASYVTYGYTECKCKVCDYEERQNIKSKLVDDSYMAPKIMGEGTIIGRSGWLFLAGYGNLPYYRATNILTEEEMKVYFDKLQKLQYLCDKKGIKLGILFSPNKDQVYSEYMPSYAVEDEYKRTKRFVDYVSENSNIAIVYPIDALREADFYWQVYYKYDSHWNDMGGFIGLQALYHAMEYEVTNPLSLEIDKIPSKMPGDLFGLGGIDSTNYPPDEEYLIHYKEDITVESKGDIRQSNIYKSTNNGENKEKLVWLGDSYRVMNIPYVEKDFGTCVIIHRDYIESIIEDIKEANVIILSAVERYDSRIFKSVDRLIEVLSEE